MAGIEKVADAAQMNDGGQLSHVAETDWLSEWVTAGDVPNHGGPEAPPLVSGGGDKVG